MHFQAAQSHLTRHPYVAGVGKEGQLNANGKLFKPTRDETRAILEHCQQWAVDQEIVSREEIEMLAGKLF